MPNIRATMIAGIVSVLIIITLFSMYKIERSERISYQGQLERANETIAQQAELAEKQTNKIKLFNELSVKSAEDIKSAKIKIDTLREQLRDSAKRVYVKASCPDVSRADKAGSMGDAGAPRLSKATQQDYIRLREMIDYNLGQTNYLRNYILTQCLPQH